MSKTTMFKLMDNTGHTEEIVVYDRPPSEKPQILKNSQGDSYEVFEKSFDAIYESVMDNLNRGKWLRIVMPDGKSQSILDSDELEDRDYAKGLFQRAAELVMVAALVGG